MNTSAPTLSPLFRSETQAEILAELLLNPDRGYTTAELARIVGAPYATVHREVARLVASGLLAERKVGRSIELTVDTKNQVYAPLAELLRLSYGPAVIISRVLQGVEGIEEAYIYGSWAARRAGEPGGAPRDIDVLVVGKPSRSQIADAAADAERELRREVNIRAISRDTWSNGTDLFVRTLQERPLTRLELGQAA